MKNLRMLTIVSGDLYDDKFYQQLLEVFTETSIIEEDPNGVQSLNLRNFKRIFYSGEINAYDIIDLICGYRNQDK